MYVNFLTDSLSKQIQDILNESLDEELNDRINTLFEDESDDDDFDWKDIKGYTGKLMDVIGDGEETDDEDLETESLNEDEYSNGTYAEMDDDENKNYQEKVDEFQKFVQQHQAELKGRKDDEFVKKVSDGFVFRMAFMNPKTLFQISEIWRDMDGKLWVVAQTWKRPYSNKHDYTVEQFKELLDQHVFVKATEQEGNKMLGKYNDWRPQEND